MSASDGPTPGTNVLVLAPPLSEEKHDACIGLQCIGDPGDLAVLYVSYTKSAADVTEAWRESVGELPESLHVVTVDGSLGNATPDRRVGASGREVSVVTANPNDITGLGMRITQFLNGRDIGDKQLVVCFDSLTSMVQYVDVQQAFKFLNMVTSQFHSHEAVAHFHINPSAHDDQTVSTLKGTFDSLRQVT